MSALVDAVLRGFSVACLAGQHGNCALPSCRCLHHDRDALEALTEKLPDLPGCWIWIGPAWGPRPGTKRGYRYGHFRLQGTQTSAHRAMWIVMHGPIPDGLHVLHQCDNTFCIRPDHLYLGTHTDNMRDAQARGRVPDHPNQYRHATHCKHGHEFTPGNTIVTKCQTSRSGFGRRCRTCHYARRRRRLAARVAA